MDSEGLGCKLLCTFFFGLKSVSGSEMDSKQLLGFELWDQAGSGENCVRCDFLGGISGSRHVFASSLMCF